MDVQTGLSFSTGDEEMYLDILNAYAAEGSTRPQKLEDCLEKENLKDYGTYIHAVKSSSKTIGAVELSDIAAMLEAAAKEGDLKTIGMHHADAIEKYKKIVSIIWNNIGEMSVKNGGEGPESGDDPEILEFYPD